MVEVALQKVLVGAAAGVQLLQVLVGEEGEELLALTCRWISAVLAVLAALGLRVELLVEVVGEAHLLLLVEVLDEKEGVGAGAGAAQGVQLKVSEAGSRSGALRRMRPNLIDHVLCAVRVVRVAYLSSFWKSK